MAAKTPARPKNEFHVSTLIHVGSRINPDVICIGKIKNTRQPITKYAQETALDIGCLIIVNQARPNIAAANITRMAVFSQSTGV
jgi:hypothetical protein